MDVSKEYILMCEKAEEIQKIKNAIIGDWYANRRLGKPRVITSKYHIPSKLIWLPRQDQLQGMLPNFLDEKTTYLNRITRAIIDDFYKFERVKTWEQLWLAFVMKEKYQKVWNGKDWKIIDGN